MDSSSEEYADQFLYSNVSDHVPDLGSLLPASYHDITQLKPAIASPPKTRAAFSLFKNDMRKHAKYVDMDNREFVKLMQSKWERLSNEEQTTWTKAVKEKKRVHDDTEEDAFKRCLDSTDHHRGSTGCQMKCRLRMI